ncbi:hypothetical protein [Streptomyces sp. NPDC059092]|uniref:hypothetical protein n=1 Tax=Streptomyces sp. NPDC059092 TaxID=3346725 RepID=UPI00367F2228
MCSQLARAAEIPGSSGDAKQAVGLKHTPARCYRVRKRHTALALAACAPPAVASALAEATHPVPALPDDAGQQAPADGTTAPTVPGTQRLLAAITRRMRQAPDLAPAWPGPIGDEATRPEPVGTTAAHASNS